MNNSGRTCVKRKLSGKDWHSSFTLRGLMDDPSPAQSFSNLNHHGHRPSFHLALPSLQSPDLDSPSSQPGLNPLEHYGGRGEESVASFLTSSISAGGRRPGGGDDRGLLSTSGLDADADLGGHLDGESRIGSHFADTWYDSGKREDVWEDRETCESTADDFYSKGDSYTNANEVFHTMSCGNEEGVRLKLKANYNHYVSYEAKTVYNRDANVNHFAKQTTSFSRGVAGSFSDSSGDYCSDSRASDNYFGREEDYGSSCGSAEDQLQPAEVEGPWLSVSPLSQTGEARWRGPGDHHTLTSASLCLSQRSPGGVTSGRYPQKLDSFSEAFLSQRKRRFPVEFGVERRQNLGLIKSRHSCAFDPDPYLPPSSSSSPTQSSLASFPSPTTSAHLMSSVLSPPPTPLPPPSHSPSKMDSPVAFRGNGHSVSQGGESLGPLQFFASRFQPLPSIHSSGMIWKFPLLAQSFPQSSGDPGTIEGNLRSDYGSITASQNILKSPESSFLSSLHPPSAPCPSNTPSLHPPCHLPSHPALHCEAAEKVGPHQVTHKVKNGSANLNQSHLQQKVSKIYTGTPFPSVLHSSRGQKRGRFTPRPLLNPARRGKGLFSSLSSLHHREKDTFGEGDDDGGVFPHVNIGRDFQADVPLCLVGGEEESHREQLLWKPWGELEESANLQSQVEKLLSMCSSSCLPGGGSNTELALHCLHYCQGNTMATLEMLLFCQPSPTGDYHYSGSDFWTESEKSLFSAALGTHGKEFSLIQKMVRTKAVSQCVEFFYLSKKLQDKRTKQKKEEENRDVAMQQKSITPSSQPVSRQFGPEEVVPAPSLASFFPCKLCGKMFYKIKSRNAHMKIHRQPQEDWTDRQLQHQLLTQRLGSNLLPPQAPPRTCSSSGLPGTSPNNSNAENVLHSLHNSGTIAPSSALDPSAMVTYSSISVPNSQAIINIDGGGSNQRESATVLPFQSWSSFGPGATTFYCHTEAKDDVGAETVEGKEPISWQ